MLKLQAIFFIFLSLTSYCWSKPDGIDYLEQQLAHEIITQKSKMKAAKNALVCFVGATTVSAALGCLLAHFFPNNEGINNSCNKMIVITELNPITITLGAVYWAYADSQIEEKEKTLEAIRTFKAENVFNENKPLDLQKFYQTLKGN